MELYNRILKLTPNISPEDFDLQDNSDGNGPFISAWRSTELQPTDAEIASVDDSVPLPIQWAAIRAQRNALLAACDWMANSDVTMSDAWTTYRQALRNLPASQSDPDDIVFPEEPS
tara:strand:- start:592 stop:939 length:348 start_codon:yes stop_codon:yes gene_type:complete